MPRHGASAACWGLLPWGASRLCSGVVVLSEPSMEVGCVGVLSIQSC